MGITHIHPNRKRYNTGLIAEAGRVGLPLNVICLNAAMSVLARSGRWYEALDLLSMMRRGSLLVDVDGGGSGADQGTGFREPRVEGEEASSSTMLVLPEPDTITFNAAITGGYGTGGGGGGMTAYFYNASCMNVCILCAQVDVSCVNVCILHVHQTPGVFCEID